MSAPERTFTTEEIVTIVGPPMLRSDGSGGTWSHDLRGVSMEFWGYEQAVSATCEINNLLRLIDPGYEAPRATHYYGGRTEPRTWDDAIAEMNAEWDLKHPFAVLDRIVEDTRSRLASPSFYERFKSQRLLEELLTELDDLEASR